MMDYDGTILESYFSPTDLVAFEVWEELADADETIHFAMFFWTDDVLTERVVDRLDASVDVYGVWDQLGAASPSSADEALIDAGAHIKIEDFPGKVHHKFAIIDVEGSDPMVILGSYNWTNSGAYDNDENTLIIHDQDLARAYYEEWQRLWSASLRLTLRAYRPA
jgi:phosphatidylserine/phosphatidylglycerophosphate/cardiolipin synthase-like enzyme